MVLKLVLHGELVSVPIVVQVAPPVGVAAKATCVAPDPVTVAFSVTVPEIVAPGFVSVTVGAETLTLKVTIGAREDVAGAVGDHGPDVVAAGRERGRVPGRAERRARRVGDLRERPAARRPDLVADGGDAGAAVGVAAELSVTLEPPTVAPAPGAVSEPEGGCCPRGCWCARPRRC